MAPFRFRAAAALDLRRKQEDEAAAALAAEEARFREVSEALAAVEAQRRAAQQDALKHSTHGIDAATLFWHRNWITRLRVSADGLRADLRERAAAVDKARQTWQMTRRRRLALDRLYARALTRYRTEEQRQELKAIDELARIRYVMPEIGREGLE